MLTLFALLFSAGLSAGPAAAQANAASEAQRGKQAMAEGRFADAAAHYDVVVRAYPNEPGMRLNLGMALSMDGRIRAALPHLRRAVELNPALLPAWLFLGANWLELGEPANAVTALRKVAAGDPGNARARELLGEALLALDRFEEAAGEFEAATRQQPKAARGWYGLGRAYEALAQTAFEALEREHGESAHVIALRAEALAASGNGDAANELRARARQIAPGIGDILEGTAPRACEAASAGAGAPRQPSCEFFAGRYAVVVELAKPDRGAGGLYWLTRAYNELARQAFGRLEALPASPERHQFRADLRRRQGRHQDSVEELRLALRLLPGNVGLERELARSLYLAKSYDEALALLQTLAPRDGSADTLFLLGDTLLVTGRAGDAVKPLDAAVTLEPASFEARASLGRALAQADRPADAIPHLVAALKLGNDEDGSLHYQLARAYQATGQTELARQALEEYAAIQKAKRLP